MQLNLSYHLQTKNRMILDKEYENSMIDIYCSFRQLISVTGDWRIYNNCGNLTGVHLLMIMYVMFVLNHK